MNNLILLRNNFNEKTKRVFKLFCFKSISFLESNLIPKSLNRKGSRWIYSNCWTPLSICMNWIHTPTSFMVVNQVNYFYFIFKCINAYSGFLHFILYILLCVTKHFINCLYLQSIPLYINNLSIFIIILYIR